MKIAISGSACTGKTTLALELGQHLNLPVIPEHFDSLFALPRKKPDRQYSNKLVETFIAVFDLKQSAEMSESGFIVDRCPLDLMNLWLTSGLAQRPKYTEMFYNRCRQHMEHYDYIVIPPWGSLPLLPLHTETGQQVRNLNRWALMHNHATIMGLARMWLQRGRLILLPANIDSVEDRIKYINRCIISAGAIA